MEILWAWLIFSIIAGIIASSKNRSGLGFFLLSIILSPLIGIIAALVVANGKADDRPRPSTHIQCPDCKELILKQAVVCKHCGCRLIPQS